MSVFPSRLTTRKLIVLPNLCRLSTSSKRKQIQHFIAIPIILIIIVLLNGGYKPRRCIPNITNIIILYIIDIDTNFVVGALIIPWL